MTQHFFGIIASAARKPRSFGIMDSSSRGSVTHWLDGLKLGESVAAQALWNHYFSRLVAEADRRLRNISPQASGQDIALSALKSAMLGIQTDRYPDISDRTELWPLLVTMTARKSITQLRRHLADKRSDNAEERVFELDELLRREPRPEFATQVANELERLVDQFDDATLRSIVERKFEGYKNEEIAETLGISVRTVIRKLKRVRQEWEESEMEDAGREERFDP